MPNRPVPRPSHCQNPRSVYPWYRIHTPTTAVSVVAPSVHAAMSRMRCAGESVDFGPRIIDVVLNVSSNVRKHHVASWL